MKSLILPVLFACSVSARAQEPLNPDVVTYIEQFSELAVEEMVRSGVPAAIKLAQGIVETQAGKSDLVLRSNNHFGIKCKSTWTGERVFHDDDEKGECFRKYGTARDSWRDHSDFLRSQPRYASLFRLAPTDYEGWATGLKAAGYATLPEYPEKLIRYIETYRLDAYSLKALARMNGGQGDSLDARSPSGAPRDSSAASLPVRNNAGAAAGKSETVPQNADSCLLHKVEPGETLYGLSRRYGVEQGELMKLNGLRSTGLAAGLILRIPHK